MAWARKGLLVPNRVPRVVLKDSTRRPSYAFLDYTFAELVAIMTLMRLAQHRLPHADLHRMVKAIRDGERRLEDSVLVIDGADVFLDRGRSLERALARACRGGSLLIVSPVAADVAELRERIDTLDHETEVAA